MKPHRHDPDAIVLRGQLLALLHSERGPTPIGTLTDVLGCTEPEVVAAIGQLRAFLRQHRLGLSLQDTHDGVKLLLDPEVSTLVWGLREKRPPRPLSSAAEETLFTIMRRGPITRREIENARSPQTPQAKRQFAASVLGTLQREGLVMHAIRRDALGKPFAYEATEKAHERFPWVVDPTHLEIEITLEDHYEHPRIYRRFWLRPTATFGDLHEAIRDASEWIEKDDPWCVILAGEEWNFPREGNRRLDEQLSTVLKQPGDKVTHVVDRGDCWQHEVALKRFIHSREKFERRLMGGSRAYPPDSCATPELYNECLHASRGRRGVDYEIRSMISLWDPDDFDLFGLRRTFDR